MLTAVSHFHGFDSIVALFTGANPHARSETVTVSVAPQNTTPVVNPGTQPTVGATDPTTGGQRRCQRCVHLAGRATVDLLQH